MFHKAFKIIIEPFRLKVYAESKWFGFLQQLGEISCMERKQYNNLKRNA